MGRAVGAAFCEGDFGLVKRNRKLLDQVCCSALVIRPAVRGFSSVGVKGGQSVRRGRAGPRLRRPSLSCKATYGGGIESSDGWGPYARERGGSSVAHNALTKHTSACMVDKGGAAPRQVRFRPRRGSSATAGTSDQARAHSKPLYKLTTCSWFTSGGLYFVGSLASLAILPTRPLCNSSSERALLGTLLAIVLFSVHDRGDRCEVDMLKANARIFTRANTAR